MTRIVPALSEFLRVLLVRFRPDRRASMISVAIALLGGLGSAAAQVPQQYTVQFLPSPPEAPGQTTPYALNNRGQVFGFSITPGPKWVPILWTDAVPAVLPIPVGYVW